MPVTQFVARKTITTIQEGSRYRERYVLIGTPEVGTTVRQVFKDSAGSDIAEITGAINGRYVEFDSPYTDVEFIPNGAGFYCYLHSPTAEVGDEEMVRYGSVFRRQLTYPHSPAISTATVVKLFEDDFQRPAGPVGGKWKVLLGRPRIFDNTEWFGLGEDHPNTVGPDYGFFPRYYMRYYVPFNDDTVDLSISATKKGSGVTIVTICGNSQGTSYLYLAFNGTTNTVSLGHGSGPDVGTVLVPSSVLTPKVTPVSLTVPGSAGIATFKMRYDKVTKAHTLYNDDFTTTYCEWVDEDDEVPHGKGYRYFGMGGNTGLLDSGVQLSFIRAAGGV